MPTKSLSEPAADVLRRATATATTVTLPEGQLDRAVYSEVNKALTRIGGGGKWNRSEGAHLFPRDPRPELTQLTGTGEMPVDQIKAMAFFRTPPEIARQAVAPVFTCFGNDADRRILEPSAGDGALANVVTELMPDASLTVVEPDADRAATLIASGYDDQIVEGTFEEFATAIDRLIASGAGGLLFDAVVMNPPFSATGQPVLWADHVCLAWALLKPGGVLSAIVPDALSRRHPAVALVRNEIAAHGSYERLPAGAFKASGTSVRTALLVATKPQGERA